MGKVAGRPDLRILDMLKWIMRWRVYINTDAYLQFWIVA
jgi:hypothetical protein